MQTISQREFVAEVYGPASCAEVVKQTVEEMTVYSVVAVLYGNDKYRLMSWHS